MLGRGEPGAPGHLEVTVPVDTRPSYLGSRL